MSNRETQEQIADRILELLDAGDLPPWEQPWNRSIAGDLCNAISLKAYRGINRWLTLITQNIMGYNDPRWLTFKQAAEMGGHVRKGEKSTRVVFFKPVHLKETPGAATDQDDPGDIAEKRNRYWLYRTYNIFNVEQTEGCSKLKALPEPGIIPDPIEQAEAIIRNMPDPPAFDTYQHVNTAPHYNPRTDQVRVPTRDRYDVPERWYNTVFHELTHATGHPKRLARFATDANQNNLHQYGVEELVAGMGSAMLSQKASIERDNLEQNASYIKHWRDTIAADKGIVMQAASRAQRAVDLILNETAPPQKEDES